MNEEELHEEATQESAATKHKKKEQMTEDTNRTASGSRYDVLANLEQMEDLLLHLNFVIPESQPSQDEASQADPHPTIAEGDKGTSGRFEDQSESLLGARRQERK